MNKAAMRQLDKMASAANCALKLHKDGRVQVMRHKRELSAPMDARAVGAYLRAEVGRQKVVRARTRIGKAAS
jgi:hypothetical protein